MKQTKQTGKRFISVLLTLVLLVSSITFFSERSICGRVAGICKSDNHLRHGGKCFYKGWGLLWFDRS